MPLTSTWRNAWTAYEFPPFLVSLARKKAAAPVLATGGRFVPGGKNLRWWGNWRPPIALDGARPAWIELTTSLLLALEMATRRKIEPEAQH
jgi:hypothetical protein